MYGCYDSIIVYGFIDPFEGYILDNKIFFNDYPEIDIYAFEIIRNNIITVVYGIQCKLDEKTGKIIVNKSFIDRFYNDYIKFINNKYPNLPIPELGYYSCIIGDFENELDTYGFNFN